MSRQELPRTYELYNLIVDSDFSHAYFQNFDDSIRCEPDKKRFWIKREKDFKCLDPSAWENFKRKIKNSNYLNRPNPKRGWQQLVEILNEVRGYNFLMNLGCSFIEFIPEETIGKKPDLKGELNEEIILCEVKTYNPSEEENERRKELIANKIKAFNVQDSLDPNFFNKLKNIIQSAKDQCVSFNKNARRIVYININFDDLLAEYKKDYYKQIDQYLEVHSISDIEIVFHNDQGCFPCQVTMKNARVVNDS